MQYKFFEIPKNLYNIQQFLIAKKVFLNNKVPANNSIIKIGDILQLPESFLLKKIKKLCLCI